MKFLLKLLICLTQFNLIPSALGDELRLDQGGKSMSNVPVHNQGDLGTCYAHTAAQGTDAFIHTYAKDNGNWHTSTTMLGTEYRDTFFTRIFAIDGNIEGGLVCGSFRRSIKKKGACAESNIEGMLDRMYSNVNPAYRVNRLFKDLTKSFEDTKKLARKVGENAYPQGAGILLQALMLEGGIASELPSADELAVALKARTNLQFAHTFFTHLCEGPRVHVANAKCRDHHLWLRGKRGLQKLIKDVQISLKKKNAQPVMMSYCGDVLVKGRTYRGLGNAILDPIKTGLCGYHASAIIGLREKDHTTQFLVRNSWGTGCYGYSADWDCENGNLWLDAEVLARNMTDYHQMVNTGKR